MRIVHVITKGDVGGAQTYVVELAAAQVGRGDEVIVVAGSDGPAMERARYAGVDVRIRPEITHSVSLRRDREVIARLANDFEKLRPDVVHGHSSKGGLVSRLAARRQRVPSVYTAHGFPFQKGAPLVQRLLSFAGEFVGGHVGDVVICLTDEEAELARRSRVVPADRIRLVPNGLPDTTLRRLPFEERSGGRNALRIVMVARFAPPKRQSEVIDALAELTDLDWTMTFVGDGPDLAAATQLAVALGPRVELLGHRNDVHDVLAASDVCLLWSGYEGMPISLLEAMRAGLACIGSDLPGVRRLFGDDGGVIASDTSGLTAALRRLINDPDAVDALGRAARGRYEDEFTMDAMVEATAAAYVDAIRIAAERR